MKFFELLARIKDNGHNLEASTTLNIMVLWSKNAELEECMEWKTVKSATDWSAWSESETIIERKCVLAIDQVNTAFVNSGIDTPLCLVHASRDESIVEKNVTDVTSLEDDDMLFITTNDIVLDDLHCPWCRYSWNDCWKQCFLFWRIIGSRNGVNDFNEISCATHLLHFGISIGKNLVSVLFFHLKSSL